jgi:amidase
VSDLLRREATELARLVREGEVSARELVEASLRSIEAVDGALNAYTLVAAERALERADRVALGGSRPFAGVPIAIKDLNAPVAGLRMSQGSELFGDYVPGYDSFAVRRLEGAGFVIVGKTNVPELGIPPVTEPRRFGPTRNPWDGSRTPGGSSGGAAAAVAAGTVPIAHGSDGGGSIRIPAACCGLVGLKPSRGRISRGPDLGDSFLSTDGVLTRTVADTAALLDVLAGYETGDATWAPPPAEPFAETARREPGQLRVGLAFDPPVEADLDPVCERAARDAGELLESLGHRVDEVREAPWRDSGLLPLFMRLWSASVAQGVAHGERVSGQSAGPENAEPLTLELRREGLELPAPGHLTALTRLQSHSRRVVALWDEYDVVLTPALARRPVAIGEIDTCGPDPREESRKAGRFTPYTALFNVTGQPAIALPLFHGDDGLPLAVQLVGPPAGEALLLSLATQLEAARPWGDRLPPLQARV